MITNIMTPNTGPGSSPLTAGSATPPAGADPGWIVNLVVWLAIFVAGAAWSLRRDTARV
jgi:hypothetical protein